MAEGNGFLASHFAMHDGHRSVRLLVDGKHIGLATTAYSYSLSHADLVEAAARLAAAWNLVKGIPTSKLLEMAYKAEPEAKDGS